jgi:hypothetical protein
MLWQCYRFFILLFPDNKSSVLYLFVFSLHPYLWGVRDWSFTLKYFFTLGIFFHLCRLVWVEENWSTKYFARFNVLTFLAILCQEAAIIWGVQFLCIQIFKRLKIRMIDLTVFIWLAAYFLANWCSNTFELINSFYTLGGSTLDTNIRNIK